MDWEDVEDVAMEISSLEEAENFNEQWSNASVIVQRILV